MNKHFVLLSAMAVGLAACSSEPAPSNDDLEMSMPSEQADGQAPREDTAEENKE